MRPSLRALLALVLALVAPRTSLAAGSGPPPLGGPVLPANTTTSHTRGFEPGKAPSALAAARYEAGYRALVDRFSSGSTRGVPTYEQFRSAVAALTGANLKRAQDASLLQGLANHGHTAQTTDSQAALRILSKENRTRLNQGVSYRSRPEMAEAERLVGQLEFTFLHNTVHATAEPGVPLFSSRAIGDLGFTSGGLNTYPFNRTFLMNDDNVFFFVIPTLGGNLPNGYRPWGANGYGKTGLILDPAYAERQAWISRYVMYPKELGFVARERSPSQGEQIALSLDNEDDAVRAAGERAMTSARNHLHEQDFTVADFTGLFKDRLLYALNDLQRSDPWAFRRALNFLLSGNPDLIGTVLTENVLHPLGISVGPGGFAKNFELKVPVAVPASALLPRSE